MANRPSFAIKVSNLAVSIKFLVQNLGFELVDHRPYSDIAYVLDVDKDLTLIAGPAVENVAEQLDPPRFIFKPGDTISFLETDIQSRQATLLQKGITDVRIESGFLGDQKLIVPGPDGYKLEFICIARKLPEDVLAAYVKGLTELDEVLEGLAEDDLDLARAPGQWSMRSIVHHLAESESLFVMQFKTALAQSGSTYIRNTYNQDTWPETLNYVKRPIEPSIAFVKASRKHLLQLFQYVSDYWERYVIVKSADSEGSEERNYTVGQLLEVMARHMWEHCEEIRAIRRIHRI